MTRRWGDDRGAVSAEFAVALPAVVIVLVLGIGVLSSASTAVRLQHAVTEAARLAGRGDPQALAAVAAGPGSASVERVDGLVCVSASTPVPGPLPLPAVRARACALDGGR